MTASLRVSNMPVLSDVWRRVVVAPARGCFITSLIQNEKTLLCAFTITCMKRRNEQNLFLKAAKVSRVRQGGDGDHMTLYDRQGQWLAMNIGERPLLRWQQAEIPV